MQSGSETTILPMNPIKIQGWNAAIEEAAKWIENQYVPRWLAHK